MTKISGPSIQYTLYVMCTIHYTLYIEVYSVTHTVYNNIVYTRGRQPMARGPNVALFKFQGAKKKEVKKFRE